jgi:hypothetical protein
MMSRHFEGMSAVLIVAYLVIDMLVTEAKLRKIVREEVERAFLVEEFNMLEEGIKEKIKAKLKGASGWMKSLASKLKQEGGESKDALATLLALVKRGEVSKQQVDEMKEQFVDIIRMGGIGAIGAIPGGSILLPIAMKIAEKYNLEVKPSSFRQTPA